MEEEKAIEEEKPVDEVDIEQDPEPEVMPTEPDVVVSFNPINDLVYFASNA